jgi:hypothetical protein
MLLFVMPFGVNGQHLSHQVLTPAGGLAICSGSIYVSQTVGETAVLLFTGNNRDLTQGFQQPRVRLIPLDQPPGTGVKVYPNPAVECLNIEIFSEGERSYSVTMYNMSGMVIYSQELNFSDSHWHVHNVQVREMVKGLYIVRVRCKDGRTDRTFRVVVI